MVYANVHFGMTGPTMYVFKGPTIVGVVDALLIEWARMQYKSKPHIVLSYGVKK